MISGDNMGHIGVDSGRVMEQERTNPSLYWLMPKEYFWDPEDVFLQSDDFNFTVKNYQTVRQFVNAETQGYWSYIGNLI